MKKICFIALAIFCCAFTPAPTFKDYGFDQERMVLAEDGIYLISSFEDSDNVTAYSHFGELLWDTSFHAKITSWQVVGGRVIVFSKHRDGHKTYLTCLDRFTGKKLWQKP